VVDSIKPIAEVPRRTQQATAPLQPFDCCCADRSLPHVFVSAPPCFLFLKVEELASCDESQLKEMMIQSDRDGVYSRQSGTSLRWIIPNDDDAPKPSAEPVPSPRGGNYRSGGTPSSSPKPRGHKRRNSAGSYGSLQRTPPASPMPSERSANSPRERSSGLPTMPSPSQPQGGKSPFGRQDKRGSPGASTHPLPGGGRRTRGMEGLPGASQEENEAFKQTRWNFLFYNLNRSVDEIYYLCEQEDHVLEAQEAIRVLQVGICACHRDAMRETSPRPSLPPLFSCSNPLSPPLAKLGGFRLPG